MKPADAVRMLLRRWYIVVLGVALSIGGAYALWDTIPPGYQRSASQLLLPGTASVPEGDNPYLYIAGLTQAADVLALTMNSAGEVDEAVAGFEGAEVEVVRDFGTAGPVLRMTVTAEGDRAAEALIERMLERTVALLDEIQTAADVPDASRIQVVPLSVDESSTLEQRDRLTVVAAAAAGMLVVTLVLAGLVDGVVAARRRRVGGRRARAAAEAGYGGESRSEAEAEAEVEVEADAETPRAPESDGGPDAEPDSDPAQEPESEPGPEPEPDTAPAPVGESEPELEPQPVGEPVQKDRETTETPPAPPAKRQRRPSRRRTAVSVAEGTPPPVFEGVAIDAELRTLGLRKA